MSQYELVDLWITHLNFAMTVFVAFLSATSALLIVAHFKGQLQRSLYRIVIALYCVAAVIFILLFAKTLEGALDIRGQMGAANMNWYNTVYEPQLIAPTVLTIGLLVQIMLAVGSLWYLKSTRSH
jgi:hypothetical protein